MATSYMYYTERPDAPLFLINSQQFPPPEPGWYVDVNGVKRICTSNPGRGYQEKSEQMVRSTRNANAQVIAQTINRRLNKFDNLQWPILSRDNVTWLKKQIAKFEVSLGYYDTEVDGWVNRKYYWGDFSAEPFEWEVVNAGPFHIPHYYKRPKTYKNIQVNLIDMGY